MCVADTHTCPASFWRLYADRCTGERIETYLLASKRRLTHVLPSGFLAFGYPQSIAECSPGGGPTLAGGGTIAIERRWSWRTGVFLFGSPVLASDLWAIDTAFGSCPLRTRPFTYQRLGVFKPSAVFG